MKKRKIFLTGLGFVSFLIYSACSDSGPVYPEGTSEAIVIRDTATTLMIDFPNNTSYPELQVASNIQIVTPYDSLELIRFKISQASSEISYSPGEKKIYKNITDTLHLTGLLSAAVPFGQYAMLSAEFIYRVYSQGQSALDSRTFNITKKIDWQGNMEPGLYNPVAGMGFTTIENLVWTHDGSKLFFNASAGNDTKAYWFDLNDSSVNPLSIPANILIQDVYSDDENILLTGNPNSPSNIYRYNTGSKQMKLILATDSVIINNARISFDGRKMVYGGFLNSADDAKQVWLYSLQDSLNSLLSTVQDGPVILNWLPSSSEKFAYRNSDNIFHIYSLSSTGNVTKELAQGVVPFSLAADGFSIIASNSNNESHIWTYSLVGDAAKQLTFYPETAVYARLSPGGKVLAFSAERDGKAGLFLKQVDGF